MLVVDAAPLGSAHVRPGTSDLAVLDDVLFRRYHIPPDGMPTPATVLDLGANIGLTCRDYRRIWPDARVVGVEMDRGNAIVAARNTDAEIVNVAVSYSTRHGYYDPDDPDVSEQGYRLCGGGRYVACQSLRDLIDEHLDGHADFVKMDVEGEEWPILAWPDWASQVRSLLVELHEYQAPAGDLVEAASRDLEAAGFSVMRHTGHPSAVFASR